MKNYWRMKFKGEYALTVSTLSTLGVVWLIVGMIHIQAERMALNVIVFTDCLLELNL